MDRFTASQQRLAFAKVCVELDAKLVLPQSIEVVFRDGQPQSQQRFEQKKNELKGNDETLVVQPEETQKEENIQVAKSLEKGNGKAGKSESPMSVKSGSVNRFEILSSVEDREDLEDSNHDPMEIIGKGVTAAPRQARAASAGVVDLMKSLKPKKKGPIDKGKSKTSETGPSVSGGSLSLSL
ncbi:hypothetical protein DITRI_Ditri09bG0138300 [Diplodiscus trichospermus]